MLKFRDWTFKAQIQTLTVKWMWNLRIRSVQPEPDVWTGYYLQADRMAAHAGDQGLTRLKIILYVSAAAGGNSALCWVNSEDLSPPEENHQPMRAGLNIYQNKHWLLSEAFEMSAAACFFSF